MKKLNLLLNAQEKLSKDQMKQVLGGTGGGMCSYGLQTPCYDEYDTQWGTAYNRELNLCADWSTGDRDDACYGVNVFTQSDGCSCALPM